MILSRKEKVSLMMKLALEFNAGIVALCTNYYGNLNERNYKRFRTVFNDLEKQYTKKIEELWQDDI